MSLSPHIQWNLDAITSGYSQDFVWSLVVRSRRDDELNKLLHILKKEGSCLVNITDEKNISTIFYLYISCPHPEDSSKNRNKIASVSGTTSAA